MEARSVNEIPKDAGWLYEPKWDGFRCIAFRSGKTVLLQSKPGQPLTRYFPEIIMALKQVPGTRFVLDGEIVIFNDGVVSFDDLLQRIHPAETRIRKLSTETPATFQCFDLLVDSKGKSLIGLTLAERRKKLERMFESNPKERTLRLSPVATARKQAVEWMRHLAKMGLDGVVAKRADAAYASGERTAMVKIKRVRTADCVVGGFRYASKGGEVGSLLLGLYNREGKLDHVGFTSSFNREERKKLKPLVTRWMGAPGFTGRAPGGPSRWSTKRSGEWQPLRPHLVCEVSYDHFSQGRFRHGTNFQRWRPDKPPEQCTMAEVRAEGESGRKEPT